MYILTDNGGQDNMNIEEMENWNIWGKRPENVLPKNWSFAIENELTEEISWRWKSWSHNKLTKNAVKRYNWQMPIILDALKALNFEKCPDVRPDLQGNVYLILAHGPEHGAFIATCSQNGELGFVGGGCIYVITPETKNTLAVIDYNITTKEGTKQCISIDTLENAISENRRIELPIFN
jgi:hypothetical protein